MGFGLPFFLYPSFKAVLVYFKTFLCFRVYLLDLNIRKLSTSIREVTKEVTKEYRSRKPPFLLMFFSGVDGSRTRVQKPIRRPSTIIVHLLGFPLPDSDRRLSGFGSFMIRTYAQSIAYAVSHLFDAGLSEDRYSGPTAAST